MAEKPNVVLVFLDDSGWGDFHPFGNPDYPTPNAEQMAEDGCRFTQFYVPQAICSASRASLLTGCYPGRTQVFGALPPRARGLSPSFPLISEVLKPAGYATGVFGKWHIGDQQDTRPPARGFDESAGLMVSNDMWRHHPQSRAFDRFPLQYWHDGEVVVEDVSPEQQKMLTRWSTEYAVDFVERHKDRPFFLYVPHSMPHVPICCADAFEGKSGCGRYGDVIMEIDWSLGRIRQALKDAGVADNTLVLFTSDNGPWISYGNHAGVTPFREAKATSFDGGTRSALTAAWPGALPAGAVSNRAFCSVDILPTLAGLACVPLPDSPIDGVDVWPLMAVRTALENPHECYPFSTARTFEGVISGDGKWKLHLPHTYRTLARAGRDGSPGEYEEAFVELSLFDMETDPFETTNVAASHPEIVNRLKALAERHAAEWYSSA